MIYYNSETYEFMDEHDGDIATKKYPDFVKNIFPTRDKVIEQWRDTELKWISEEIELKSDGNKRARGNTMAELRGYRNAVKDYESGEKPVRPE